VDQHVLGRRLAESMHHLLAPKAEPNAPIEFDRIEVEPDASGGGVNLVVRYKNVVGKLHACGNRPVGFTVTDSNGQCLGAVFDVRLRDQAAVIRTNMMRATMQDRAVHYGLGPDPVCNIVDDGGRSLPVMGPIRVGERSANTPFVQRLLVSPFLPGQGKLTSLKHPGDLAKLGLARRQFPDRFLDLHLELAKHHPQDQLIYFATKLYAPEAMKLSLCLGYDGPVKAWVDGKPILHDPAGVNPAWEDKLKTPFAVKAGLHDVLIALGTNECKAWGIFLRFERLDVTATQLEEPGSYAMPTIVDA